LRWLKPLSTFVSWPVRANTPGLVLAAALLLMPLLHGIVWAASGALDFRFRPNTGTPAAWLGGVSLSQADRDYLASLPELRVALLRSGQPPYERVAEDGQISGLHSELLNQTAAAMGLRLRPVVFGDAAALMEAVRLNRADIVLTTDASLESQQNLTLTLGTSPVPAAVMARREGSTSSDLDKVRIVQERGGANLELVRRRFPQATLVLADNTDLALQAVATQTADVYVGGLLETLEQLARQPVQRLELQQVLPVSLGEFHFGVRKDHTRLVPLLNQFISAYRGAPESAAALRQLASLALPAGMVLPKALALDATQRAALAGNPIWRIGAVRGAAGNTGQNNALNGVDAQNQHVGIAADYTEQVARRLGVATTLVMFDSIPSMLDGLRLGGVDVVPLLSYTPDRARDFGLSKPYLDMPYVLVGRSNGPLYWDLASLRGKRLALPAQHPLLEDITRNHPTIQIVPAATGEEAMDLVVSGAADAAVEIKLFANQHINRDPGARLRALAELSDSPAQFRFATAGDKRALLPLIDAALADIPVAERDRMQRRWVAIDLTPPFPWLRWAPLIALAAAGLAAIAGLSAWWMRRLREEVRVRRRAVEQLDDIGRAMPGVAFRYVLDTAGRLRRAFYSSGSEAFLGVVPRRNQTLIGALAPHMPQAQHQAAMQAQRAAFKAGNKFRFVCEQNHPQHGLRWLQTEAVPSTTADGHVAWTGYVIDVTAEQVLQRQVAQQARDRHLLLASASHELRAPTHTLGLALEAIGDEGLPSTSRRALAVARNAASTLGQLLDDVLDSARLDAGGLKLNPQDLDLTALLHEVAEGQRRAAQAKGLQFEMLRDDALPSYIRADGLRLRQVVVNLLSNAVKYTPAGPGGRVSLHASKARLADGRDALLLSVSDSGPGISQADQARLFEPFVTVPGSAEAAHAPSTGLGLSICRRLVGLMDGDIALTSELGAGTTFTVRLPLQVVNAAAAPALRPARAAMATPTTAATGATVANAAATALPAVPSPPARPGAARPGLQAPPALAATAALEAPTQPRRPLPTPAPAVPQRPPMAPASQRPTDAAAARTYPGSVPQEPIALRAPTPLTREAGSTRPGALQPVPLPAKAVRPGGPQDLGTSGFGSLPPSGFTPLDAPRSDSSDAEEGRPAIAAARVARAVPTRTTAPVRSSGVVLMCDDDEVSRVFMAELLQRAGYAVVTAANARQALNIWQSGGVRAVITDLVMAGMDGMALVNALRQAEQGQSERTVIVVCSGSAPPPLSGPDPMSYDAFLPKPVQGQVLARTLARLLGPPAMPQAARA
jgi:two-component system, NarL family, sensor histidine kinase EvgS